MEETHQRKTWESDFGEDYLQRNLFNPTQLENLYITRYGISKTDLNEVFLKDIPKNTRILEVGTNIGNQLLHLQSMGFSNLYGIEIQDRAINFAKHRADNLNIIKGDAIDIPFKDNYFDLVFTHGVLIHISPKNINKVLKEIYRVSKKYIWGLEYFAEEYNEIKYHGQDSLMWKTNFMNLYKTNFDDLRIIKEQKLSYLENNDLVDQMFIFEK
jgi:pseudaminic acid biosynthesis-associated methylase